MFSTNKTVAFDTLGCKLNFSETSTIARNLLDNGYERVEFSEPSGVYVINTCSVTANADKVCRRSVKKAVKSSPAGGGVGVGCYAELTHYAIAELEDVVLV